MPRSQFDLRRLVLAARALACALLCFGFTAVRPALAAPVEITILHTNDMHAHAEPVIVKGVSLGGYARLAALIKRYRASDPNPVLLCAGDTFQGTTFFSVYEGMADAAFMTAAGYQAMALGNHELDKGVPTLLAFARTVPFPLLAANLDLAQEPALAERVKASTIIELGGERLGVVGTITPLLPNVALLPPTVVMKEQLRSVQGAIDALQQQGVNKVVLLSHSGYGADLELAERLAGIDVIVGGHSHTLLGSVPIAGVESSGPYPTVKKSASGETVLIVQAWEWGKVLGRIKVTFDAAGRVEGWADAAPVPVDASVEPDPVVASMIAAFARPVEQLQTKVVGRTDTGLGEPFATVRVSENTMASAIADAMLAATARSGSVAAFMNGGGVRTSLPAGAVTYGGAVTVQPFGNSIVQLEVTGATLKQALEDGVAGFPKVAGGVLHPSHGSSYAIDYGKPAGQRVSTVVIAGKALDPAATYRISLNSFTAKGGDGHSTLAASAGHRYDTGITDIEALVDYFKEHSPVNTPLEGRIVVTGLPNPSSSS